MCYAVIEVRYRNKTEPDQLVSLSDEDAYNKRVDDLKKLDTVERITVFKPAHTHQRVSSWDTTDHNQLAVLGIGQSLSDPSERKYELPQV